MATFAKIGRKNKVETVETVSDNIAINEQAGENFLNKLHNSKDVWKKTDTNGTIRKNYAGIGYTYDLTRNAFISPKPYASWILNETTCRWEAPVARPDDNNRYNWNETTTNWDVI